MNNPLVAPAVCEEECEDHQLTRAAYAIGAGMLIFGAILPHSERWMAFGLALITFSILY